MVLDKSNPQLESKLLTDLFQFKEWAFDTETTEDTFIKARLRGISFYFPNSNNYYYRYENYPQFLDRLKPFFEANTGLKIGHEIKYDIHILLNHGVKVNGALYDTKLAYWLLDSNRKIIGLKDLGESELGEKVVHYTEAIKGTDEEFAEYAKQDARLTYKLYLKSIEQLKATRMLEYYNGFEIPTLKMLVDIERRGITLDIKQLEHLRDTYTQRLDELHDQFLANMFEEYDGTKLPILEVESTKGGRKFTEGVEFNIQSNRHLATLFYEEKGYPVLSKTESGSPATHEGALKQLLLQGHKEVRPLLEYKELTKLLTTYIEPLLTDHNNNGKVYPYYVQTGTATGRFASKTPNIQNIPIKTASGKDVRKCLVADKGYVFLDADFGQLELRIAAHWSQDEALLKAFNNGVDVIDIICETVLGVKKIDQTKEKRVLAKAIAYGTLFGAGPKRLADEAGVDIKVASAFLRKYFAVHKRLKMFQLYYPLKARQNDCYATSLFGRRRLLKELGQGRVIRFDPRWRSLLVGEGEEEWKIHAAEREALSMRVQGTAADIMKSAMLKVHKEGLDIRAQIHDELLVHCPVKGIERQSAVLKLCMEKAVEGLSVPLVANIKVVNSWGEDV